MAAYLWRRGGLLALLRSLAGANGATGAPIYHVALLFDDE